jgi:AcrR family transcriptional regulator
MVRPRNFSREEVLEKALPVFWKHGFADASLQILEKATGVNKSGLYSEFSGKEDLFLESLRFYLDRLPQLSLLTVEPPVYTVYMSTAEQILKTARAAFARGGLESLSMRDVAKEIGITAMAIYRHYASKQALVDALVLDALDEWSRCVAAIPPANPLEWLRSINEAHLEFALRKRRRYEAAFLIHSGKARRYPDDFNTGRSPAGALQLKLIAELMRQGVLKAGSPIEIMVALAALSQGLITLYRAGRIVGGEAEFRELYLRTTERSMASFFAENRK